MIQIISYTTVVIYSIAIILIFFFSLAQLNLLINYLNSDKKKNALIKNNFFNNAEIPIVTIQLPIYNEKYVSQRLIDNIVLMDYPKDKLEIQVLDDSTDDSVHETRDLINKYASEGIDIKHIRRSDRKGFKAGALKEGLEVAKGEFIAIFDADFLPKHNWLFETIPNFTNKNIGAVQTRWTHINRNYSILTKIQAFALDTHFTLEQVGRNFKEHYINFNGTAGVWRKECIIDAGNWESDTLTEDLDLSYRAQLKKWKFVYLVDVETPAELPAIISAARSQQYRWNKGGAENFRKLFFKVLKSDTTPNKTKIHGILHLLNSSMFLCIFIMAILSIPILYIKNSNTHLNLFFDSLIFFIITSVIFFIAYWFPFKKIHGGGFKNFLEFNLIFFTFYSIAMGFSFQNSIAVIEGLVGKKSDFIRTPKFNIESLKEHWKQNIYISKNISKNTIIEGLLIIYFIFGLYSGYKFNDFSLLPFHLMLCLGFSYVFFQSLKRN